MIQVVKLIIYINENESLSGDLLNHIKSKISESICEDFASTEVFEGIRISFFNPGRNEIGIIIFILFMGIYQTHINYSFIYKIINKIFESYKNKTLKFDDEFIKCKLALKNTEIIKPKEILTHLEKYFSIIISDKKNKSYDIDVDIETISNYSLKSLKENEYFLKCHRTTKFHDIDIKLWETRLAFSFGLSLTSIVMLGVTLEECIKTVLKNDYEQRFLESQTDANFSLLSEASLKAEEKYGNLQLYPLINFLYEEKYIDEGGRKHLLHIKDYVRNAFIHSDKSKIFDKNRKGKVDVFKLEDERIKHVETQNLSMLEMSFAQGFMQKRLADENAKIIFYEIEEYIYLISDHFWKKWKEKGD